LLLAENTEAFLIEVDIVKLLETEIASFDANSSTDLVKFSAEIRNKGSIAYTARARVDVMNVSSVYGSDESYELFTAWSPEKEFMPGDRKSLELHWYNNKTGSFTVRLRVYYGNEILERFYVVEKDTTTPFVRTTERQKDVFWVDEFRVYDKIIIFDVTAREDSEDIVVIPTSFTRGWIFEQEKITKLKAGRTKTVVLSYEPTVFTNDDLKIATVSAKSGLYSERAFKLVKNEGLKKILFSLIDRLKMFLSQQ
jgi:hypothetical protein